MSASVENKPRRVLVREMLPLLLLVAAGPATVFAIRSVSESSSGSSNCSDWRHTIDVYGTRVFMLGDRAFEFPQNVQQLETLTCPRLLQATERVKHVIRSCLKPFAKTVAGMIVRGARKVNRGNCNEASSKAAIVSQLKCMQDKSRVGKLHDVVDVFTRWLHVIRRTVPDDEKIDVTCCRYLDTKRQLEAVFKQLCAPSSVSFSMNMVDEMLREAVDFMCSQHQKHASKCQAVLQAHPVSLSQGSSGRKPSLSFLLPLIDVLTAAAGDSAPEDE